LASDEAVKKNNLKPLARIVSWGFGATEPKLFPLAPPIAMQRALKVAGLEAKDISAWEINEAFFAAFDLIHRRVRDADPHPVAVHPGRDHAEGQVGERQDRQDAD
jgi:acetyl-CoA C-acetyltransferase